MSSVAILKYDSVQVRQIKTWMAENRADLNIDDAVSVQIIMAVKYAGMDEEYKKFKPLNVGCALLTFEEPDELVYIPLTMPTAK